MVTEFNKQQHESCTAPTSKRHAPAEPSQEQCNSQQHESERTPRSDHQREHVHRSVDDAEDYIDHDDDDAHGARIVSHRLEQRV
jgi:hypothetical protein